MLLVGRDRGTAAAGGVRAVRALALGLALSGASSTQGAAQDGVYPGPYYGEVIRVIDGDTLEALIGIWPTVRAEVSVRLKGIDAPETFRPACEAERYYGHIAATNLADTLPPGAPIRLSDVEADVWSGRVAAEVWRDNPDRDTDVARLLLGDGVVRRWRPGQDPIDWCAILARGGR